MTASKNECIFCENSEKIYPGQLLAGITCQGCAIEHRFDLTNTTIMTNHYCKYCGSKAPSVSSLTSASCVRHPNGPHKGHHALYEGGEKSQYTCKHCGTKAPTLSGLTSAACHRHPDGANKGKHEPAI